MTDTPPPSWYEPPDPPVFSYQDAYDDVKRIDEQIDALYQAAEEAQLHPQLMGHIGHLMQVSDITLQWLQLKIQEEKR